MSQESNAFIEPPEWIPLLPKQGKYKHPVYGEVVFDEGRNQRFADNLKSGLYQTRVPIDAEHQLKTAGALGWITDVRLNADGTADGRAEWTERGANMLRDNRFAFVSPEFYDKWTAPDTGVEHQDILIGCALTSRPFFKESSMRSLLSMSEAPQAFVELNLQEEDGVSQQFTEQQYTELQRKFDESVVSAQAFAEKAKLFEEQLTKAQETIETMQFNERIQRFKALTQSWAGDQKTNIQTAELWAYRFGEESDEFKSFVQSNDAIAAQSKQSNLFSELGSSAPAQADNLKERIDAQIAKKMSDRGIDHGEAMNLLFREQPELYQQYSRQIALKV